MYALIPRRYKVDNNNNPSNPDTQGNPELRPEVAWGLDAGYEHYLGKQAMFSVSAFVRRIDDVTVRRLTRDQIGWVIDQTNNGRADASGVLLEAKSPLRQWWPGGPDMDIRASAARNWSRIHAVSGPHNRLDEQEPANANLAVDYRPAGMPLTLSANVNYRAGSTVRWSALVASSKAPARVLDLHAVWKLADGMRLRAGVLKLLLCPRRCFALVRFVAPQRLQVGVGDVLDFRLLGLEFRPESCDILVGSPTPCAGPPAGDGLLDGFGLRLEHLLLHGEPVLIVRPVIQEPAALQSIILDGHLPRTSVPRIPVCPTLAGKPSMGLVALPVERGRSLVILGSKRAGRALGIILARCRVIGRQSLRKQVRPLRLRRSLKHPSLKTFISEASINST